MTTAHLMDSQPPSPAAGTKDVEITVVSGSDVAARQETWSRLWSELPPGPIGADPRWLAILRDGLGHRPYGLEAHVAGQLQAILPLAYVATPLFGRFLVSLPFVSSCGVLAADESLVMPLLNRAVQLADELRVKHLELRLERPLEHPDFQPSAANKILMRRTLPATSDALWKEIDSKVRNQIRKGEKQGFDVQWGGQDRLESFYRVFSRNMRDLGTPVFPRRFFAGILSHFGPDAEFCTVSLKEQPVAAALLLHGRGTTKVPCASALREFSATNANMFMYWQLLKRAVERGQTTFDFGRSTIGSGTERFKAQWDAEAAPAHWISYVRDGRRTDLRKESATFALLSRAWKLLPLPVAEFLGPRIVRGIP
ncbi:MAG TPA: FemAB family XrtA/PEP-CTERM system-associated protein [Pirellulaceae bacterium]|nr:FemAB family XrtA/PEP-CTERM system-associated protein [Pirellulaceae bacterium]